MSLPTTNVGGHGLPPPEIFMPDFIAAYGHPLESTIGGKTWAYTDSGRTTAVTASGDSIGSLTDFSSNNLHAQQAVSGIRPVAQTGIAGKLAMRTNGTDAYVKAGNSAVFNGSTRGFTVLSVFTSANENGGNRAYALTDSETAGSDYNMQNGFDQGRNAGNYRYEHGIFARADWGQGEAALPSTGGICVIRLDESNGLADLWSAGNTANDTFTSLTPINPDRLFIGCGMSGGITFFGQYDFLKLIVWNTLKTNAQIDAMLAYERAAWGLP